MSAMMIDEIPAASAVEVKEGSVEALQAQLKGLDAADLFKVMKVALAEVEKKSKTKAPKEKAVKAEKAPKGAAPKKAGSQPKGVVPHQLRENKAWVKFVLEDAQLNGWESYVVHQSKKDKETGEKIEEEIVMRGSVSHQGSQVFEGSITEKQPKGKTFTHKDAMSLSSQYWTKKTQTGTRKELHDKFLETYVDEPVEEKEVKEKAPVVRMTAEEKEQQKEEKKVAALKAKEEKALQAAKEKAEKKEKAEAEKAAKKEAAAKEKEEKKKEKEAKKEPKAKEAKEPKEAKEAKKEVKKEAKEETPVKPKAPEAPKAPVKPKRVATVWTCENDGLLHPWQFKGREYLRNYDNEVWHQNEDGDMADWCGVYLVAEDRIDDSAAEPMFE